MKDNPPNAFRKKGEEMGMWSSTDSDGMMGAFSIPMVISGRTIIANCIVSDGRDMPELGMERWEHVSCHVTENGRERTPSWEEMVMVKYLFWNEDETVVEYHPAKSNYINIHPHVLHLWRRVAGFPTPPKVCV
jgi:hypothetical protein